MKHLLILAKAAQGRQIVRRLKTFRDLHWDLWFIPLSKSEPPERAGQNRLGVVYAMRFPEPLLPDLQHLLETRMRDAYLLCVCVRRVYRGCHPRDQAFVNSDWAVWV